MINDWLSYQGPQVPKYLRDSIKIRGGVNPYKQPRYRLVLAQGRFEQSGGVWKEWSEHLSAKDRTEWNAKGDTGNRPIRVTEGMRWVPKYPIRDKWILEKWLPADKYGLREQWPFDLLGAYPEKGDYEATGYEFPSCALTEAIVLNAIGRIERYVDSLPSTIEGRIKRAQYIAKERDAAREAAHTKRDQEIVGESSFAFGGNAFSSLSAPKGKSDIEKTAEKLGINIGKI